MKFTIIFLYQLFHLSYTVKIYEIDLNKAPEKRWIQVAEDFAHFAPQVRDMAKKFLPTYFQPIAWKIGDLLSYFISKEYDLEFQTYSKITGVPYGELVLINVLYDITAFDRPHNFGPCTSMVVADENGTVWHGRNLDYTMTDLIKNMTFIAKFTKDGAIQYEAVMFAYYLGILTGQRPGVYTVSLNERYSGGWWKNIIMALYTRFHNPISLTIRKTLESKKTFKEAVQTLSFVKLIAPCFIIMAGEKPYEGLVITRDRWQLADLWTLTNQGAWYRVETNYDHWLKPGDKRRETANRLLANLTQAYVEQSTLLTILGTHPIVNEQTIFTTLMSPKHPAAMSANTKVIH